jgi:OmpA-OmpF porin, OOP family
MVARALSIALFALTVACGGASSNKPKTVVTSETTIEVLDPVSFTGEAELAPSSSKILDAVASTLEGNPSIKLVEVQVFVIDGDEATRQQRADRRAQAIVDYLVGKGVAAARLRTKGFITPDEEAKNHVSFMIAERG